MRNVGKSGIPKGQSIRGAFHKQVVNRGILHFSLDNGESVSAGGDGRKQLTAE